MVRTQIQLTKEQLAALKRLAAERGVSVAELVRQGVEAVLREASTEVAERRRRAIAAIGSFRSDKTDVSERHDDYFVEAIEHNDLR